MKPKKQPKKHLTPSERAELLFVKAEKLGLDHPTVDMISEAINDAQSDALLSGLTHDQWYGEIIE